MKQVIFIGFSTTGKSTLIDKIAERFPNRAKFDTDKAIARDFGKCIANIYYADQSSPKDELKYLGRFFGNYVTERIKYERPY